MDMYAALGRQGTGRTRACVAGDGLHVCVCWGGGKVHHGQTVITSYFHEKQPREHEYRNINWSGECKAKQVY